ncbi:hypothetical protein ACIBW9_21125 [Streptomyces sp. NPDC049541]|uniref:hypothetical protein n=1 Tax=Streptomyces sp. NPDC049541 TaxID=3365594 RepID=UPI0037B69835
MSGPRELAASCVALGPSGVAVHTRLKLLASEDERVLRLVGGHLGTLAGRDLKARCAAGLEHDAEAWAARKRALTKESSSRWAGSITKGRRALGHPIRRRTAPPPHDRSDRAGHRTVQAAPGREGTRPRIPGPRTGCVRAGDGAKAGDQRAQHRSGHAAEHELWQQDSLPLSLQERSRRDPAWFSACPPRCRGKRGGLPVSIPAHGQAVTRTAAVRSSPSPHHGCRRRRRPGG